MNPIPAEIAQQVIESSDYVDALVGVLETARALLAGLATHSTESWVSGCVAYSRDTWTIDQPHVDALQEAIEEADLLR